MRVLITGISGFTGRYLYRHLLTIPSPELWGLSRNVTAPLQAALPRASLVQGDILDYELLKKLMEDVRPDYVFHLAGQRPASGAWADQRDTFTVNCLGTMSLFEALKSAGCTARVLLPSSSAVYGVTDASMVPITEEQTVRPINVYGVSKAAQEEIGTQYFLASGIAVIIARLFNCIGPGQEKEFVTSSFAHQLVQVKKGYAEPKIEVGNLKPVRDYIDVRDVVRAYWLLMERGAPGETYNVCSGRGYSVQQVLDILIRKTGVDVPIVEKAARVRAVDIPVSIGSYDKLHRQTGWQPQIDIGASLGELLDFWEKQSGPGENTAPKRS
jgi:GDP-4-dehydro-6-deoxy-D-mannose reductase